MTDSFMTRTGVFGGTMLIFFANITTQHVVETIGLSALGATVSFFVSYFLKRVMRKRK